jgi:hypothetical protein
VCLEADENGLQRQNKNRNPTVKQTQSAKKLHRKAKRARKQGFFRSL